MLVCSISINHFPLTPHPRNHHPDIKLRYSTSPLVVLLIPSEQENHSGIHSMASNNHESTTYLTEQILGNDGPTFLDMRTLTAGLANARILYGNWIQYEILTRDTSADHQLPIGSVVTVFLVNYIPLNIPRPRLVYNSSPTPITGLGAVLNPLLSAYDVTYNRHAALEKLLRLLEIDITRMGSFPQPGVRD